MRKILLALLWLSAGLSVTMAQKATISFNPPKGKTYEYHYETVQKVKQSVMGQEINSTQRVVTVYDVNVLENTKDGIKTNYIFKQLYCDIKSMMGDVVYDSTQPKESSNEMETMFAKTLGPMVGKQFEVVHAPDGSVISVSGMDTIIEEIKKEFEDDSMRDIIEQQLTQQFGSEMMKESLEQSMKVYPNKAVKVGDTWDVEQTVNVKSTGLILLTNSTYQLNDVKKKVAYVQVKSTIKDSSDALSGDQWGNLEFDLKSGFVTKGLLYQKMAGTITVQGMEVAMEIDSEIKIITVE